MLPTLYEASFVVREHCKRFGFVAPERLAISTDLARKNRGATVTCALIRHEKRGFLGGDDAATVAREAACERGSTKLLKRPPSGLEMCRLPEETAEDLLQHAAVFEWENRARATALPALHEDEE